MRQIRVVHMTVLLWVAALGIAVAAESIPPNLTLFVATNGNDTWSGKLAEPAPDGNDGPLASLEGARNRLRQLRSEKQVTLPVDVLFRAGRHMVERTVEFGPDDSATEQTPVTFAPYRDEKVELCGGTVITGWTVTNGVWTVTLPDVAGGGWYFQTLFVNGQRAQRARTPDNPEHFLHVSRQLEDEPAQPGRVRYDTKPYKGFGYRAGDLQNWPRLDEAVFFCYEAWARGIRKVESLDETTRTVVFRRGAHWTAPHLGETRYWVENLPELLNAPGEWYLDRRTGVLSYIPRPGETPENTDVLAPHLATFVQLRGDAMADKYVEYLHFRDLAFRYADWEMEDTGYIAFQADVTVRGAIDLVGARHNSISRCEISHVGLYAINLAQGSRHVHIWRNHLFDLGAGGVKIGHNFWYDDYPFRNHPAGVADGKRQNMPLPPEKRCGYTSVENNFIHHGGVIFASGIGVCVARGSWNRIAHNEISDFPYSGVSVGMSWDAGPSQAHDNLIEYNHIHRIGRRRMSDLGGIYLLGNSPGTVVRGNHIHDIHHRLYGSTCLYGDQGSSRILIEDNMFHDSGGTLFNGGFGQNTVRNNIFAIAEGTTFWCLGGVSALRRNLIYSAGEGLCVDWAEPGGKGDDDDGNLYWDATGAARKWAGKDFDAWRAETGREAHSLFADPGFADPAKGDFTLKPDSPAFKLGFEPLDVTRVGLYGEKEWVELPQTITPLPMADLGAGQEMHIRYDFEDIAPGGTPEGFDLHLAREQGGDIAVTADVAFEGKHSLRFQDSQNVKEDWNPHMYRQLGFGQGTLELSFALMSDSVACPTVELRDYANGAPFTGGPSIAVDAQRRVLANGKDLGLQMPPDKWVQFRVTCRLDQGRNGVYDLSVTLPDGTVKAFSALSYGPGNFKIVTWLGIVSSGKHDGRFYIDNLTCDCRE
ncbi:MAG: hypothetical protein A3K19_23520 [Lentisphaerae bacterium RIFOXYB12_FULL_65_16]|nr:MAG: hypothetical protein A3K18_29285 [Lentisphaerae bacterium RIFOXYA12_64_32]OGV94068.1 MAG: hypothetical protein A3K19_23520 [Lentisphaerae bacterium RIFOXYB12_FULL_65_16]